MLYSWWPAGYVRDSVFSFESERQLKIHDPFLGILEKAGWILVGFVVISQLVDYIKHPYVQVEPCYGVPEFTFGACSSSFLRVVPEFTPGLCRAYAVQHTPEPGAI